MNWLFVFVLSLLATAAHAVEVRVIWTLPELDVNGNPAQVTGVRLFNDDRLVVELGAVQGYVMDLPHDTPYSFRVSAGNSEGWGLRSVATEGVTPPPPRGVPVQMDPPEVLVTIGEPVADIRYRSDAPSRDSIHPAAPAGAAIEIAVLQGDAFQVNPNGSASADGYWEVLVRHDDGSGWTEWGLVECVI